VDCNIDRRALGDFMGPTALREDRPKATILPKELKREMTDSNIWSHALALQATRLNRRSRWLGVPVIVLAAATGTAIFASLNASRHTTAQIAFGTASLLAAVLSALKTYLNYDERAQQARGSANEYEEIYESFRRVREEVRRGDPVPPFAIQSLNRRYDRARKNRPMVPDKVWDRAKDLVSHRQRDQTVCEL
jgi:hypothetical protein